MPPKLKFAEGNSESNLASHQINPCIISFMFCTIEGEKVLCFHGPLIYEAKALKSQLNKDKTVKYLIHYAGWSKK